jgi:hypothetical protein
MKKQRFLAGFLKEEDLPRVRWRELKHIGREEKKDLTQRSQRKSTESTEIYRC